MADPTAALERISGALTQYEANRPATALRAILSNLDDVILDARAASGEAQRARWAKWIAEVGEHLGPDWACAECKPGSEILVDGFRCVYHEALAAVPDAAAPHKPGDPHQYRTECKVCGETGYFHVSLEPQTVPAGPG